MYNVFCVHDMTVDLQSYRSVVVVIVLIEPFSHFVI